MNNHLPSRKRPADGNYYNYHKSLIVFITICTKNRIPWLANETVHRDLLDIWNRSTACIVGKYLIMPDHIHLFISPVIDEISVKDWVRYWKSQFTKKTRTLNSNGNLIFGIRGLGIGITMMKSGRMSVRTQSEKGL